MSQLASLKRGILENVLSVEYSTDGYHIIFRSYDKAIRIWNGQNGTPAGNYLVIGHNIIHNINLVSIDTLYIIGLAECQINY